MDGSMASRRVGHEVSSPFDAAPEAAQGGVLPLPIASQASPGWLRDAEQSIRSHARCRWCVWVLLVLLVPLVLQVLAPRHRS